MLGLVDKFEYHYRTPVLLTRHTAAAAAAAAAERDGQANDESRREIRKPTRKPGKRCASQRESPEKDAQANEKDRVLSVCGIIIISVAKN